ncbi:hypothetical protein [Lysinibacter cavernae]|uniref:Lipoprotein n=1 Tax=Lysinibacter cavernae TaxID=1640652 RepID=A0A7X5R1Z0_9MICO|nr:hypothetical protein [Lysinibacter cavernae]NIH54163.1 hypothetical protein [Lysinibacter cavernae]
MKSTLSRLGVALASIVFLIGVSACSPVTGDSDADGELKSGDSNSEFNAWNVKFTKCMKAEGVDMPEVQAVDGSGTSSTRVMDGDMDFEAYEQASKTCLDEVGKPPVQEGGMDEEEMKTSMLAFAKCMREAGYDYPDPVFSEGGTMGMAATSADDFAPADLDRCNKEAGLPEMKMSK